MMRMVGKVMVVVVVGKVVGVVLMRMT